MKFAVWVCVLALALTFFAVGHASRPTNKNAMAAKVEFDTTLVMTAKPAVVVVVPA